MTKTFILNRHKDFYEFGYKKPKVKALYKKTDPYDELRYGDDSEESEKDQIIKIIKRKGIFNISN